jgi:hypothetical protein
VTQLNSTIWAEKGNRKLREEIRELNSKIKKRRKTEEIEKNKQS